jgi:hypothetical protein
LLEVDRPAKVVPHDFAASPPFFSFGEHHRQAIRYGDGLSMLAFASDDARGDIGRFSAARLPTFTPFDFERSATLPGGAQVTVAFSLAFVQSREMPRIAFFVSENRVPGSFWKPEYQVHANGVSGIVAVYLSSPAPERDAAFIGKMFGGEAGRIPGGVSVACGSRQEVRVLTPDAIAQRTGLATLDAAEPMLAGIAVSAAAPKGPTPAAEAGGMFLEWVAAQRGVV